MSEDQFRRLKQLSKAQTMFLKAYVAQKITSAASLVDETLKLLEMHKSANNEAQLSTLRTNLLALKVRELEADPVKAEAIVREELALLRGSLEGNALPALKTDSSGLQGKNGSGSSSSSADIEKISSLEAEVKQLKEQIELLKERETKELSLLKAQYAAKEAELAKKDETLSSANRDLESLRTQLSGASESSKSEASLRIELEKLKGELKEAKEASGKSETEFKTKLAESSARIILLEGQLVSEKEEFLEAMAQEVEAVEKAKAEETVALRTEFETVKAQLAVSRQSSAALSGKVRAVEAAGKSIAAIHKELKSKTAKEIGDIRVALLSGFRGEFQAKLKAVYKDYLELKSKYLKEMGERRRLHNIVSELKGNIRVFMRCRPPSKKEVEQFGSEALCVSFSDMVPGEVRVFNSDKGRDKTWEFDEAFDFSASQERVYAEVSPLVVSVLDGYNVCIFAYGQTGSGKTFTMSGPRDDPGVNTRALEDLFAKIAERSSEFRDVVSVSLLEVYNEEIRDLLVDPRSAGKLEVKQGEFGNHVPGLSVVPVANLDDVLELFVVGDKNRSSATTNMNEHSSRSHMILTITVLSENVSSGTSTRGKLNLVDLAGSERIEKSGATGQALKEAQNINQSLSALGDVIQARGNKQAHVPFRNSTLTYLLQDSLSKDSKTLMFVCASPVSYNAEETFCSLNFAARVRAVELGKASKNAPATSSSSPVVTSGSSRQSINPPPARKTFGR